VDRIGSDPVCFPLLLLLRGLGESNFLLLHRMHVLGCTHDYTHR
jgi:hypothetical protein